jgi:hypothetical protein
MAAHEILETHNGKDDQQTKFAEVLEYLREAQIHFWAE